MLDEIDKLGGRLSRRPPPRHCWRSSIQSRISRFSDHYLDVPFDLSKVMFITTANILDTIPSALIDRMEVLKLLGYTLDEKIRIAFRFLIPRQLEAHGLVGDQLTFTRVAIKRIISDYTREAGLRNLEREIATICRGVASKIVQEETKKSDDKGKEHRQIPRTDTFYFRDKRTGFNAWSRHGNGMDAERRRNYLC